MACVKADADAGFVLDKRDDGGKIVECGADYVSSTGHCFEEEGYGGGRCVGAASVGGEGSQRVFDHCAVGSGKPRTLTLGRTRYERWQLGEVHYSSFLDCVISLVGGMDNTRGIAKVGMTYAFAR